MENFKQERRKYERYITEAKVFFRVAYDLKTRVKFRVINFAKKRYQQQQYHSGVTKNICAEALCFSCGQELKKGDFLFLELYLPKDETPILMEGSVIWSKCVSVIQEKNANFEVGVRLAKVNDVSVVQSIYFDEEHQVTWSAVLEAIFGSFRKLAQEKPKLYRVE